MHQIDASLERLGLDHVDLYQIHGWDPQTPMDEALRALDDIVRSGRARYIGVSNWAAWQIMKALGISERLGLDKFASLQAYYTVAGRDLEREIVPMLQSEGVGLMVWSPLAGGLLSGKYTRGDDGKQRGRGPPRRVRFPARRDGPRLRRDRRDARRWPRRKGKTVAQIALAWLLHQPVVSTVIVGAKRADQLADNIGASEVEFTAGELERARQAQPRCRANIPAGCSRCRAAIAATRSRRGAPAQVTERDPHRSSGRQLQPGAPRAPADQPVPRCGCSALDEVWWLVSPGNPLKPAKGMAPLAARLASARAQARRAPIRATAIERELGTRYTLDTLRALKRRYPRRRFVWIMGADNLAQFHRWKDWRGIAREVPIAVFARPGYEAKAFASPAMAWLRPLPRARQRRCARRRTRSPPLLVWLRFDPDPDFGHRAARRRSRTGRCAMPGAPPRDAVTGRSVE